MIENELTPATREKEFIAYIPEFGLDFPNSNPSIARTAITLRQEGHDLTWRWKYRVSSKPIAPLWGEIAESLLSYTSQDLKRFPNSARAHTNLGTAFLGQGALDQAAEHFSIALSLDSRNCLALGSMARTRMLQDRLEESEVLYRRLREENPDDASSLVGLAQIAVLRGSFEEGVTLFQEAGRSESSKPLASYHLALLLMRLNRAREAIGYLKEANGAQAPWPALHEALAVAYVIVGNLHKAETEFKIALRYSPDSKPTVHGLAEVLYRQGKNAAAANILQGALAKHPDDVGAREILARIYEVNSEYKHARQQLLEAEPLTGVSSQDQSRIQNNIGVCTSLLEQRRNAAQWFAKSIESAPAASSIPYLNSARTDIELSDFDSAINALRLCQFQFPAAAPQIGPLLAACLSAQGKEIEAAQELRRTIEKGAHSALAYSMLGGLIVEGRIRDLDGAISVLEEGNDKYPRDARIGNNLAYAYLQAGLPGKARTILEDLIPDEAIGPTVMATWGLLRLWEGALEEGEERYKSAEKLAQRHHQIQLAEQVRQKMYLELAKSFVRSRNILKALPQIKKGLMLKGRKSFRRDLEDLRSELERIR
jgi:tetratricopeptide (TPR) repeat protein